MTARFQRMLAATFALIVTGLTGAIAGSSQVPFEVRQWAEENYAAAIDATLPFPDDGTGDESERPWWTISVRVHPKWDGPEWQLTVEKGLGDKIHARLVWLKKKSALSQLIRAGLKNPELHAIDYAAVIKSKYLVMSSDTCPALLGLGSQFEELRISPLAGNYLTIHPIVYEFWIDTYYGQPFVYKFADLENSSYWGDPGEQPHPLVSWVKKARAAIDACQ